MNASTYAKTSSLLYKEKTNKIVHKSKENICEVYLTFKYIKKKAFNKKNICTVKRKGIKEMTNVK